MNILLKCKRGGLDLSRYYVFWATLICIFSFEVAGESSDVNSKAVVLVRGIIYGNDDYVFRDDEDYNFGEKPEHGVSNTVNQQRLGKTGRDSSAYKTQNDRRGQFSDGSKSGSLHVSVTDDWGRVDDGERSRLNSKDEIGRRNSHGQLQEYDKNARKSSDQRRQSEKRNERDEKYSRNDNLKKSSPDVADVKYLVVDQNPRDRMGYYNDGRYQMGLPYGNVRGNINKKAEDNSKMVSLVNWQRMEKIAEDSYRQKMAQDKEMYTAQIANLKYADQRTQNAKNNSRNESRYIGNGFNDYFNNQDDDYYYYDPQGQYNRQDYGRNGYDENYDRYNYDPQDQYNRQDYGRNGYDENYDRYNYDQDDLGLDHNQQDYGRGYADQSAATSNVQNVTPPTNIVDGIPDAAAVPLGPMLPITEFPPVTSSLPSPEISLQTPIQYDPNASMLAQGINIPQNPIMNSDGMMMNGGMNGMQNQMMGQDSMMMNGGMNGMKNQMMGQDSMMNGSMNGLQNQMMGQGGMMNGSMNGLQNQMMGQSGMMMNGSMNGLQNQMMSQDSMMNGSMNGMQNQMMSQDGMMNGGMNGMQNQMMSQGGMMNGGMNGLQNQMMGQGSTNGSMNGLQNQMMDQDSAMANGSQGQMPQNNAQQNSGGYGGNGQSPSQPLQMDQRPAVGGGEGIGGAQSAGNQASNRGNAANRSHGQNISADGDANSGDGESAAVEAPGLGGQSRKSNSGRSTESYGQSKEESEAADDVSGGENGGKSEHNSASSAGHRDKSPSDDENVGEDGTSTAATASDAEELQPNRSAQAGGSHKVHKNVSEKRSAKASGDNHAKSSENAEPTTSSDEDLPKETSGAAAAKVSKGEQKLSREAASTASSMIANNAENTMEADFVTAGHAKNAQKRYSVDGNGTADDIKSTQEADFISAGGAKNSQEADFISVDGSGEDDAYFNEMLYDDDQRADEKKVLLKAAGRLHSWHY
ncbi:MAG: hypothetical protein LBB63_00940 [Holosporaceae bacterium]|jgi:hypothetical protein|nr:hypothetical protein [Holosporaceae bacterium]